MSDTEKKTSASPANENGYSKAQADLSALGYSEELLRVRP